MKKSDIAQNNTKLCKCLISVATGNRSIRPDTGPFEVEVKKDVAYLNGKIISMDELWRGSVISGYDKAVMDAIYSIWAERDEEGEACSMKYTEIYNRMNGGRTTRMNAGTHDQIRRSIQKLRRLNLVLYINSDLERVAKYFGMEDVVKHNPQVARVEGYLLDARNITFSLPTGKTTDGIRVLSCPILYQYAEAQHQIITVSSEWITLPGNTTEKKISVRDYLISYIRSDDYRDRNFQKRLSYKAILEGAGIEWSRERKNQYKDRTLVNDILNYYISIGAIKGYDISDNAAMLTIHIK